MASQHSTPARIVYVNGDYLPLDEARVPIMDRGFLFADGVYEVSTVIGGRTIDNAAHLARLARSLAELDIAAPFDAAGWVTIQQELIRRNALDEGTVYIQVTRGVAERDFAVATAPTPTVVAFTQAKTIVAHPLAERGARIVTTPDLRWARCDIKTIGLLAQVIAKTIASKAGAYEAVMIRDGHVTEGSSSSFFIVNAAGEVLVRPLSPEILPGITRNSVLRLAAETGVRLVERRFTLDEVLAAREAFLTGAVGLVMPVVSVDGQPIGDGAPGALTRRLRAIYLEFAGVVPARH